jgi:hypothetical protein
MDSGEPPETNVVRLRRDGDLTDEERRRLASTIFAEQDEVGTFSRGNLVPPKPATPPTSEDSSALDPFFEKLQTDLPRDHMPGAWFSTTAGRFLQYESLLERDWMLLMDFDRDVEGICEQPLRLRYQLDGKLASHVPDLLVWRGGTPELCDVKSEERVDDPVFRAQVEATGRACAEAGFGYRVLSEPDPQLLVSVRWLAGFRERPPDPDGEQARMLSLLAFGSCTVGELLSGARELALARPMLMHMLWAGEALADLSAPLGEDTVAWARLRVAA